MKNRNIADVLNEKKETEALNLECLKKYLVC